MQLPIQLISTDFDGTFHADHENPPVPVALEGLIARLQERGVKWVINTGRDLSSLMETLARARISIRPDYVVVVEREIYIHQESQYLAAEDWNRTCQLAHAELFARIQPDLARLISWVNEHFEATVYEDAYSPFCLLAEDNDDADEIHQYLLTYSQAIPQLTVVRNDVYARFSHEAFNKGTALSEIGRQLGINRDFIVAAGDHLNDLPMLSLEHARYLIAPSNAVPEVKELVRRQQGYISHEPCGHGVARGLELLLERQLASLQLPDGEPKS